MGASKDSQIWREKYRSALSQQEQLEKTISAQQALLHRTVLALSQVAQGHDTELDERLAAIRGSLKNNDVGGFDRMVKSLTRIGASVEKRRQNQWSSISKNFAVIADNLYKSNPSGNMKSAVKRYKKALPKGELLPATLNRLLEDLHYLQAQAAEAKPKNGGLLNHLFQKNDTAQEPLADNSNHETQANWEAVDEQPGESPKEVLGELVDENEPLYRERRIPEAVLERPQHEPAFSRISDRVTVILKELLEYFPPVPCVEEKANRALERINKGLNWYELTPTLEDIRDFVIQSHMGADDNYRLYLKNVYAELSSITMALGIAIESEQRQRMAHDELHHNIDDNMESITQALIEHNDIDDLKSAVNSQVKSIRSALKESQQPQEEVSQESLSDQLSTLIERVKQIEKQDADIREQLENERIRAVTDSLTGLPNREAYSEKVHEEMLRWQRYQHPLCLAVLDIDFFKKINDSYGHATGDKVLKAVSSSVASRLREVDFMSRFGGEEFVILLPETSAENALAMLNRTRERLSKTAMRSKDTKFSVTVSIGIAQFNEGDSAESVFERADKALYDAKENGRNQCIMG